MKDPRWICRSIWAYAGRAAWCGGLVFLILALCSCMSATYDMRKLEQPVTMNGNPFAPSRHPRLSLKPVDGFSALVSEGMSASSGGGQSQNTHVAANEAQAKAFEKIGGDRVMTITDVQLQIESLGINLVMAMGAGVKISATGTVQKIVLSPAPRKEDAK